MGEPEHPWSKSLSSPSKLDSIDTSFSVLRSQELKTVWSGTRVYGSRETEGRLVDSEGFLRGPKEEL